MLHGDHAQHFALMDDRCTKESVVSWAGLLVIEQSMLRFDVNRDNILSPSELDKLYVVFRGALEALIPVDFLKRYSKDIFRYIVKFQRLPETEVKGFKSLWRALRQGAHFVRFLFKSDRKQSVDADRMTYAAVLKIIAENTPSTDAPFDCETLR